MHSDRDPSLGSPESPDKPGTGGAPDLRAAPRTRRKARQRTKALRRRVGGVLLPVFGPLLIGLVKRTWRVELRGVEHLEAGLSGPGLFIALWHGRMLVGMPHHARHGWNVLVSPSEDGGLAKTLLERYGYSIVRGSSSRGGSRAVREMMARIAEHTPVVIITPDGPRGPRHSTNPGLAWMARETGCPVLPIGLVCDRAWHLSSWDAFTLPKPWARLRILYGELLRVPPDADDADLETFTARLRTDLIDLERQGFEELGRGWDLPSE